MNAWRWYVGLIQAFGDAVFEAKLDPDAKVFPIRRISKIVITPRGEVGLVRWIASEMEAHEDGDGTLLVSSLVFFYFASNVMAQRAEALWQKPTGGNGIVLPSVEDKLRFNKL